MKKLSAPFALASLMLLSCATTYGQAAPAVQSPAQSDRMIGEVTIIDAAARSLSVKPDAGQVSSVSFDERTIFRRVPPGTTSLENAERITSADVGVGDRVLVLLRPAAAGQTGAWARQVVVVSRAALDERAEREREETRRRNLAGRVTSVDVSKRELTIMARGREGPAPVVVAPAAEARVLRFAPDSMRPADAVPSSFAEIRVGDQIRARGERSADGSRFTAEEITAGQFARIGGKVVEVNAARGELTLKADDTGKTVIVTFSKNSTIRRVTPEVAEQFEQRRGERREMTEDERRAQREARRSERAEQREQQPAGERRPAGEGVRGQRGGMGGGNLQQLIESLPAVTLSDLRKGDAVLVTGTPSADQARLTTIMLLTGDADFLQRLQRIQGRQGDAGNMNPGLPGDVLGGGNPNREPPPTPPL